MLGEWHPPRDMGVERLTLPTGELELLRMAPTHPSQGRTLETLEVMSDFNVHQRISFLSTAQDPRTIPSAGNYKIMVLVLDYRGQSVLQTK